MQSKRLKLSLRTDDKRLMISEEAEVLYSYNTCLVNYWKVKQENESEKAKNATDPSQDGCGIF